jgi:hypothetical protein
MVVAGFLVALAAACAQPQPIESPSLPAAAARDAVSYLQTHPVDVPKDWLRGILAKSVKEPYTCLGGTCWTWTGVAITADGSAVALRSVQGENVVGNILSVGDDFMWTKDPHPSYAEEVRVIRYGAVTVPQQASPSATP